MIKKKLKSRKDQKKNNAATDDSNLFADGAVVAKALAPVKNGKVVPIDDEKDDEKDDDVGFEDLLALDKGDGKGVKDRTIKMKKGASKVAVVVPSDGSVFPDEEDDALVMKKKTLMMGAEKGEKNKCKCQHC